PARLSGAASPSARAIERARCGHLLDGKRGRRQGPQGAKRATRPSLVCGPGRRTTGTPEEGATGAPCHCGIVAEPLARLLARFRLWACRLQANAKGVDCPLRFGRQGSRPTARAAITRIRAPQERSVYHAPCRNAPCTTLHAGRIQRSIRIRCRCGAHRAAHDSAAAKGTPHATGSHTGGKSRQYAVELRGWFGAARLRLASR